MRPSQRQPGAMIAWSALTALDWFILVVVGISTALSLWRGFVREAISLAGWVAAFILANMLAAPLAIQLGQWVENPTGAHIVAFALLFVATLIVATIISRVTAQLVRVSGLTVLDRLLGTVFGFARGVILILFMVYMVQHLARPEDLQWLHHSQLMPHLEMLAQWVRTVFAGNATLQWTMS